MSARRVFCVLWLGRLISKSMKQIEITNDPFGDQHLSEALRQVAQPIDFGFLSVLLQSNRYHPVLKHRQELYFSSI
jgi:hypothetical protein